MTPALLTKMSILSVIPSSWHCRLTDRLYRRQVQFHNLHINRRTCDSQLLGHSLGLSGRAYSEDQQRRVLASDGVRQSLTKAIQADTGDEYCTYRLLDRRLTKFLLVAYQSCHESEERERRQLARKWFPCQILNMRPCLEDKFALATWLSVKLRSLACQSLRSLYMQNRAISAHRQKRHG
jgi:hypothetical protein